MAKLIDILARELKVWPVDCKAITQDSDGYVVSARDCDVDCLRFDHNAWSGEGGLYMEIHELASDHKTAIVTRAEWQDAVEALNAPKVVEWYGVGLPPVGEKVEVILEDDGLLPKSLEGWKKGYIVECIAHFAACGDEISPVFFNEPLFSYSSLRSDCYRPIRTAEQVAAEEREAEDNEVMSRYMSLSDCEKGMLGHSPERVIIGLMRLMGYRKQ